MPETIKCSKCGQTLGVTQFYRQPGSRSGYQSKCKTCHKRDVRENRLAKIDYYKDFDRSRSMLPHRVKAREEYAKSERGRLAGNRAKIAFSNRFPFKKKASEIVGNAVRDGKIKKMPCEVCGKEEAQAHHDDYTKPLDVRWLCTTHHAHWHKNNKPICPSTETRE